MRYTHFIQLLASELEADFILTAVLTAAKTRAVPGAVDGIRSALEWAGLEYDFGITTQVSHYTNISLYIQPTLQVQENMALMNHIFRCVNLCMFIMTMK